MLLENECSDLKEKLENLLKDFGNLKSEMQNKESNEQNAAKEAIEVVFFHAVLHILLILSHFKILHDTKNINIYHPNIFAMFKPENSFVVQ